VNRHAASLLALVLLLAGCGGYEGGKTPGTQTVLEITAWPSGKNAGRSRQWKLYCERAGGTLPAPERACQKLFALEDPFAVTPPDAACTKIYGGPAVAKIEGLYQGETVNAEFSRTDGCEIARWNRHAFLFPVKPAAP
jgi:Subtilisin inhibitor-like